MAEVGKNGGYVTNEEFVIIQQNQARAAGEGARNLLAPADPEPTCAASEAMIQKECVKFMEEDGWRHLRTDPVSDKARGKGFGELGMADSLMLRYESEPGTRRRGSAMVVWIEWKSRDGKPKKHQIDWHTKERSRGALTWIASVDFPASVEGFRSWYVASRLQRRARWW